MGLEAALGWPQARMAARFDSWHCPAAGVPNCASHPASSLQAAGPAEDRRRPLELQQPVGACTHCRHCQTAAAARDWGRPACLPAMQRCEPLNKQH